MNWKRILKSWRWSAGRHAAPRARYRPRIDSLEERAVSSNLNLINFAATDDAASTLTISGDVEGGGQSFPITQQGPGALTTTYAGKIKTHVNLNNDTIHFSSKKTALTADNSGTWQPDVGGGMGSAPANYGGMVSIPIIGTGYGAIRNSVFGIATPAQQGLPLTQDANGNFEFPSQETFTTLQGNFDYNVPGAGLSGDTDFSGNSQTNNASANGILIDVNGDGSLYEVVIPVNVTFSFSGGGLTVNMTISGTITGYGKFHRPGLDDGGDGLGASPDLGTALSSETHAGAPLPPAGAANLDGLVSAQLPSLAIGQNLLPSTSQVPGQSIAGMVLPSTPTSSGGDLDPLSVLDTVFQNLA